MINCKRCGRSLTARKSIERGYGPVCWTKLDQPIRIKISQSIIEKDIIPLEEFWNA